MSSFMYGVFTTCVVIVAMFFSPMNLVEKLMKPQVFSTIQDIKATHDGAVFITGCSSGIGRAAGLKLALEDKLHVFCTIRKEVDAVALHTEYEKQRRQQQQSQQQEQDGDDPTLYLHTMLVDVTKSDQIYDAKRKVQQWLKEPDTDISLKPRVFVGVVCNAGVSGALEPIEFVDVNESLRWVMSVNVDATIHVYQAFLPLLRLNDKEKNGLDGGGRVVLVGSVAGQAARPFRGVYTMSKIALEGLADTMRQEVLHENISVSMVNPGYIKTNIFQAADEQTAAKYKSDEDLVSWTDTQRTMLASYKRSTADIVENKARSVDETTADIYHALTSRAPKTRYYPGSCGIGQLPAWIWPKIKMLLPDRVVDNVILKKLLAGTKTK